MCGGIAAHAPAEGRPILPAIAAPLKGCRLAFLVATALELLAAHFSGGEQNGGELPSCLRYRPIQFFHLPYDVSARFKRLGTTFQTNAHSESDRDVRRAASDDYNQFSDKRSHGDRGYGRRRQ